MRSRMTPWLLILVPLAGCHRGDLDPKPSPDGSMVLQARIEQSRQDPRTYLCVVVEVRDPSGRVLFAENSRASDVMRWNLRWVGNDRIQLESSDIGPVEWNRQADGSWVRKAR